jgi:hypothetical protein
MENTRRHFLRSAALFGGAFVFSRGLAACAASSTNGAASASDDLVECAAPVISRNHGHSLVVTAADVAAGVAKTYDIQGAASHAHSVTLSAADFAKLAAGGSITVASTTDFSHSHGVTVTCATAATPDAGSDAATSDASADATTADAS